MRRSSTPPHQFDSEPERPARQAIGLELTAEQELIAQRAAEIVMERLLAMKGQDGTAGLDDRETIRLQLGVRVTSPDPPTLEQREEQLRQLRHNAPNRGPLDAPVSIVLFSDFECPFCKRMRTALEKLLAAFPKDIRLVFRNQPLNYHPRAMLAAEAAAEAFAQGGDSAFWQMHDLLFSNSMALDPEDLESYARRINLDIARFRKSIVEHKHKSAIEADKTTGLRIGASGAPTVFINNARFKGERTFEQLERAVVEELARPSRDLAGPAPKRRPSTPPTSTRWTLGGPADQDDKAASEKKTPRPQPVNRSTEVRSDSSFGLPVGGSPCRGLRGASVTIIFFADLECPFCRRAEESLRTVSDRYGNDVRIVWKHSPQPFHPGAMLAAEAMTEALAQRGSKAAFQMADTVFSNLRSINRTDLELAAAEAGLNVDRLRLALEQRTHREFVEEDMRLAERIGAIGTPSFFINGKKMIGSQPTEILLAAVADELKLRSEPSAAENKKKDEPESPAK